MDAGLEERPQGWESALVCKSAGLTSVDTFWQAHKQHFLPSLRHIHAGEDALQTQR